MRYKKIDVHFRIFKDGQVTAVFPYEIESHTDVLCYSHVGQHSVCSNDYVHISKPVKDNSYIPLMNELKNIGYELNVIKKRSHKKYMTAYWAKRGVVSISR